MSDLSASAVIHTASGQAAGTFYLALAVSPQMIALSVTDSGSTKTVPKVAHQDQEAEHGRGLGMVSVIADLVAVHNTKEGHTVTAHLFAHSPRGAHPC
jgi:anti-sigma regulatory factor (Ser/Thr protein kinase)